ncbi:MAG: tetratricopeptide repeat protein [Pyrinomonadaceae bacterium]|nr:tetratricopeptide repeat protein [Pyrinomonadaceae bacterium]
MALSLVLSCCFLAANSLAQGSDLEKTVTKKASSSKSSSTKKKAAPKKTPAPSRSKKSTQKSSPKRRTTRRASRASLVDFSFSTPQPNQQIWLGEEMLGVSNEEALFVKSIKPGNYLVSVRDVEGNLVLKSQLVKIASDSKSANLKADEPEKPEKPEVSAEELLSAQVQEQEDLKERILKIFRDYGDPVASNTVSLSDWEFVNSNINSNELTNFTVLQVAAQRWFASGQIELSKGNFAEALTSFKESKKFMPKSAYPDYAAGETYLANGQSDYALQAYSRAVAVDNTFALAHAKMGDIYGNTDRPKESAVSYRLALKNGYETPAIRYSLAKVLMKTKRWEEAAQNLEYVLREAPTGDAYMTLGDLYAELKRPISTYEAYRRATELMPRSSTAFFKLGTLLFDEREYDKSREALQKAIELDAKGENFDLAQARKYIREAQQKLR